MVQAHFEKRILQFRALEFRFWDPTTTTTTKTMVRYPYNLSKKNFKQVDLWSFLIPWVMTTTTQQDCQAFGSKAIRSTTMFLRFLLVCHVSDSIAPTSGSLITRNDMCDLSPRKQPCGDIPIATLFANWSQQLSRTQRKRCVLNNRRSCATNAANAEIIIDDMFESVISKNCGIYA